MSEFSKNQAMMGHSEEEPPSLDYLEIPFAVINEIDQGRNPDSITANIVLNSVDEYKKTKKKADALHMMKMKLLEKVRRNVTMSYPLLMIL